MERSEAGLVGLDGTVNHGGQFIRLIVKCCVGLCRYERPPSGNFKQANGLVDGALGDCVEVDSLLGAAASGAFGQVRRHRQNGSTNLLTK